MLSHAAVAGVTIDIDKRLTVMSIIPFAVCHTKSDSAHTHEHSLPPCSVVHVLSLLERDFLLLLLALFGCERAGGCHEVLAQMRDVR